MPLFRGNKVTAKMNADLGIRSAKVQGYPPFPTWNGTISAPLQNKRGLCSVLAADGELVVLQTVSKDDALDSSQSYLRVVKVLPPARKQFSSFCQCWVPDESIVATAHDSRVSFYTSDDFHMLTWLQLRYIVTSLDIIKLHQTAEKRASDTQLLLLVGTAFGAFLYLVSVRSDRGSVGGPSDVTQQTPTQVARVYDDVAVCMVKFSRDGRTVAIGTADGRLFLREFDSHGHDTLASFGTAVLSRVLQAPRVTSLCFSGCSTKLVVATRKGNVYVFTCASETGRWRSLPSCFDLSSNPKPKAGGTLGISKSATTAQTLVSCWGPVFVVCSRAIASRLDMYDFMSGSLLHSLQLVTTTPASSLALSQWAEPQLVTGICSTQMNDDGSLWLLCHDTSANVTIVKWPFLDHVYKK